MKITKSIGNLLLAAWLILQGIQGLRLLPLAGLGPVMAVLALAAGIFILLGR